MPFTNTMTWDQWVASAGQVANQLETVIPGGYEVWRKFNALIYGKTDAEILALPAFSGRTQADLNDLRTGINTFKTLYDAYRGYAALAQFDYSAYLISLQG
jgi:hypothetical protein